MLNSFAGQRGVVALMVIVALGAASGCASSDSSSDETTTTVSTSTTSSTVVSTTTSTPATEPVVRTVTDSFLGGTWTRDDTYGGDWGTSTTAPEGAATWLTNGTAVQVMCMQQGESYEVVYAGGRREEWSWHARLDNGEWIRAAVIQDNDGNETGERC